MGCSIRQWVVAWLRVRLAVMGPPFESIHGRAPAYLGLIATLLAGNRLLTGS
jgi:hypothetical protein